jgi:hypothetical protein
MISNDAEQKLRITMTAYGPDGSVELSREFDNETDWHSIAGLFYQFLAGMTYKLDPSDVSATWE